MANLTNIQKQYILHWGEMGTRWGINRTVAQIHALLYLSPKPLAADEIAETLTVARSNVSTSIRELESWGIDPTLQLLRSCLEELKKEERPDAYVRERLEEMTEFFETGTGAYEEL